MSEDPSRLDRGAIAEALRRASISTCVRPEGPRGAGHAILTFLPSGAVSDVVLDDRFRGTQAGACVAARFKGVHIPTFGGGPVRVGRSFVL
ncbi:MAG: virulence associated protein [Labilithrix sp.]|nr:virulence associated protein [Labilithrix sp.]